MEPCDERGADRRHGRGAELTRVLPLALIVSLTASPLPVAAQQPPDTAWSRVRQLTAGDSVRVVLNDGSREGAFRTAGDDSITIAVAGQDQSVPRVSVSRILVARGSHRKRNVLLGLAIGGVTAGVVVSLRCRGKGRGCNEVAPAYFYPLAGAGAGVGALLPARAWTTVYP